MNLAAMKAILVGDMANAKAALAPGGIEAQEAAGQKSFVREETLPVECPRDDLENIGFVFGKTAGDLFINTQFPKGWVKEPTDHSMWSDLIDNKGRKRGGIFYKAAFYDQRAFMHLDRRYSVEQNYEIENGVLYEVKDCDRVIHKTELIECGQYSEEYFKASDDLKKKALNYLEENFPEWDNNLAYWD